MATTGAGSGMGTTGTGSGMGKTGTGMGTTGTGMGTTGSEHHHHSGTTGDLHTGGVTGDGCLPGPPCAVAAGSHTQLHGMLPTLATQADGQMHKLHRQREGWWC